MPAQRSDGALRSDDTRRRYEDLVASLDGIVWEADARTFRFTFVSPQAERLLGYPLERWLEPGFWIEHVHPDERDWVNRFCLDATRGHRNHSFEYRMIAASGRPIWLRDHVTVIVEDGEATTLRGVMVDITDAKDADIALRETVERLRLAAHAGNVGLWDWDLRTNAVVFSREWKHQLGYDETELPDGYTEWQSRLHPDDAAATMSALEGYLHGALAEYAIEFRMRHKDGSWRWIYARGEMMRDAAGVPARMLGCHVDVTERKLAEEERLSHVWFLESMDRVNRAIQGTSDLDQMLSSVLDVVLAVFDCDRAYLVFQSDPAASWTVRAEATKPEFPGALALGVPMTTTPETARLFRAALSTPGPLPFGIGYELQIHEDVAERFAVRTGVVMVLRPKVGAPWSFGLHQCRSVRVWSKPELRLFQEVGRRLADALNTVLMVRQLEESEHRLREAERLAHVGYWHHDYERDVITWSDETYRIHGLPLNMALEPALLTLRIHPDDRTMVLAHVSATLEGGSSHDLEFRIVRPDGEVRIVHSQGELVRDVSGRPLRLFGTVQDVTERRRTEQAMSESHNLLNAVIEGTDDVVFVKDLQRRYLMINSAGARHLGRPHHEIIGRDDGALLPEVAASIEIQDREVLETGKTQAFEQWLTIAGASRAFFTLKSAFRDTDGRIVGLIGIGRDITEHKRLEEQLRQAQKMEAVGRLAGGIAHDFNNILTVINGFSRQIFDRIEDERNLEALTEIIKSGERAADLTRQLLAFSRKQRLQPQVVDVNPLLSDLAKLLRALIGANIALVFKPSQRLGTVEIDRGQFEQAIINLAVNARDAMPRGGRLIIETGEQTLDETYVQSNPDVRPGRYVRVVVADSGTGMDDATKARIFEPFFTTKEPGKGTGLGLAMVYGFVMQSGGHIEVTSAPGAGTSFSVYLPVSAHAEAITATGAPLDVPSGTETVLVVEDEPAVRSLIRAVLRSSGYTVLEAADGEAGLAMAAGTDARIDVLLTDLVMPRLGGQQMAELLRRARPDMRVVFMSGYTDQSLEDDASGAAAVFLQKPFTPQELARKVRETLDDVE
jgi:PAS domain S-box-containing protein